MSTLVTLDVVLTNIQFMLADNVAAFDKLDSIKKILAIYCDLPSLTLDPVSKKHPAVNGV